VRVVANSAADRERLGEFLPGLAARATTIVSGVNLEPFRDVARSPFPGRIVVVGRVTALKGIDRLLRALPLVTSPWSLVVHGAAEGDEPARLVRLARELGIADRVELAGGYETVDEPGLFSTPSLAVFPSTSEALGLALVDAMAAGVPVLASDIAGHRDALGSAVSETVVDFDEPTAVAAAIERVLAASETDTAALTARLRERARHFDIGRLITELDDLYRSLGVAA
jgi:D-inositol-3-phosphate glycosyltransferase